MSKGLGYIVILSGNGILGEYRKGRIFIDPFDPLCISPNSYDLHLSDRLLVYDRVELFYGEANPTTEVIIPVTGYRLVPGTVYLGCTYEYTKTMWPWVPDISGRSSLGRLGLGVHVTAEKGQVGFEGRWTLELTVVQPLTIKPHMKVCQISYTQITDAGHEIDEIVPLYKGKYNLQHQATPPLPD